MVDGSATGLKVGNHLHRDLGGKGRHTLGADPVISGKDQHLRRGNARAARALPTGHPKRQILQPTQSAGRFGQLPVTRRSGLMGGGICSGGRAQELGKFGKRGEGGHGIVLEGHAPLG